MGQKYILAIDQGTTASTALVINVEGQVISKASREIIRAFPQPGWVEQDPQELYESALSVAGEAIEQAGISPGDIDCLGITNQRETTLVWNRHTGKPIGNAIGWQCRRTARLCEELKRQGFERIVQEKTGLIIDAYFSATKIRWLLDSIPDGQKRAENGDLLFGTVDTWLVWNLTGGNAHVTDYSNASRTMLYNIHTLEWDKELLQALNIPENMLPEVVQSSDIYGETGEGLIGNNRIPIGAIVGDQQAALFGQACYESGSAKNTYGTGSFVLLNTGTSPVKSEKGLVTTLAWGLNNKVTYAMEGSIFITGAAVQWLRDGLGIISKAAETEEMALSVKDTGGVYFVPTFSGMGAPYWDMYARGTIVGLTQGTSRDHLVRATLEAIAYQSRDVIEAMGMEAGLGIPVLRVDGGGSANKFTMQFQSDILGIPIQVSTIAETTALGAGYLAGLATGFWKDTTDISKKWRASVTYEPAMSDDQRNELYAEWKRAVERAKGWIKE
ncbi:MAG: glycerol kinase [Chloroflexi bacterium RBG_13_46_14]|nr:MAG: glycerol kinase [Chloroflexi bacterium RBG_13_46_14]